MWKRVKNGVQGRVVRFRVPGGAEPAEAGSDERPMPIAASILWKPIEGAAEQDAGLFPVFITQRALAAVHDHCAATTAACFGLLIGDVVDSPETGASHVVVESAIRLPAGPVARPPSRSRGLRGARFPPRAPTRVVVVATVGLSARPVPWWR